MTDSFPFTRQAKGPITAIEIRDLKIIGEDYKKKLDERIARWNHELTFGSKPEDFVVSIGPFKKGKSWPQLKGIHRLCRLLAVRLTESNGVPYDEKAAKIWVKTNFDYMRLATDAECVAEALNEKQKQATQGTKMDRQGFVELVESFKGDLLKVKSFADASMDELVLLVKKIEELGNKMVWPEMKLTSEEDRAMKAFYKVTT